MLSFFRNLPIFAKIFGSMTAVVLAIVAFQLAYFPSRQIDALRSALENKGSALARLLAAQTAPALDFGDDQAVKELFEGASRDPDFVFAVALKEDGESLATKGQLPYKIERQAGLREIVATEKPGDVMEFMGPLESKGGAKGTLVLGLSKRKLVEEMQNVSRMTTLIGVIMLAFAFGVAYAVGRFISRRLAVMAEVAEKVAHGDLSHPPLEAGAQDDVGRMAAAFNRMLISQRNLVKQIADTAVQLNKAANEFSMNARQQEQGAREQSSSIEEISSSMSALSDTARVIATNADTMSQVSEDMSTTMRTGQEALRLSRAAIGEIAQQNDTIADRINKLYEKSQAIINVVDIIDDISDRLDLLALNAALEGSRVGDVGKGFSLVAQEMRRLAENVIGSTKEIKETIEEIHRFIQASLEASQQGMATSRQGVEEMAKMADSVSSIFNLIEQTTESSRKITVSTQQQLSSTQQMVAAMGEVAAVSTQGLVSAQEVTRAASDMTDLGGRLRQQVNTFRIEGAASVQN